MIELFFALQSYYYIQVCRNSLLLLKLKFAAYQKLKICNDLHEKGWLYVENK